MFWLLTPSLEWASATDHCPPCRLWESTQLLKSLVNWVCAFPPQGLCPAPEHSPPRFQHGSSHHIFGTQFRWVLLLEEASLTSRPFPPPHPTMFSSRHLTEMSPFIYYLLSAPSPSMTEWAMSVLFSQNPQRWVIAPTQQSFATHLVKN